jgi:hypothetical protein
MSNESKAQVVSDDGYGLGSQTTLQVPRGNKGLVPLNFDMTNVYRIVSRTEEIQRVTPASFPELITDFNMGMIELNRIIGLIEIELKEAEHTLDTVEAIAQLEKVEAFLKSKGLSSTADNRKAAVILDPDVQQATRTRDALTSILTYVNGLKASMERAYFSAKHVADLTSKDPYLNKYAGDTNGSR